MLNEKRVLVPTSFGPEGMRVFEARPELRITRYEAGIQPAELHRMLADAAAVVLSWTRFGAPELAAAPLLQVAARLGVGFDAVDVPALTARRIPLFTAGTANSRAVAEHAVHFIFALAKKAAEMDRRVRHGLGHDRMTALGGEIADKTVLVVGFGRIGTRVAPRLKALEMTVLVHDPYVPASTIAAAGYEPAPELDAALPRADYVTIHCPKNVETIGLFGRERLARMKPGAYLVNTARGGIVDEAALADAVRSGAVGGAGLDVFDPEPPDPAHPLLALETVIASPHMAGVTTEAWAAIGVVAANNVLSVFDGRPARENAVNPEALG